MHSSVLQAAETVDLLPEIRRVYTSFLPLFPYCYAYWKRYSDIERKAENWDRALAILRRGLTAIPLAVDLWVAYLELYHKLYSARSAFHYLYRHVVSPLIREFTSCLNNYLIIFSERNASLRSARRARTTGATCCGSSSLTRRLDAASWCS